MGRVYSSITAGQSAAVALVVGIEDTAPAMRSGSVEVLATPRIVALVEQAAVASIAPSLPIGTTSVGSRIELRHLAPSTIGAEVVAVAEVTAVTGKRVEFAVRAEIETGSSRAGVVVATGSHTRVLVDKATFGAEAV